MFEVFNSLGGGEIFILIEPAEDFSARVHQLELFAEAIFNLHGDFVIFQGQIRLAEVIGDLGKLEVQFGVAGVQLDGDRGAIESFIEQCLVLFGLKACIE